MGNLSNANPDCKVGKGENVPLSADDERTPFFVYRHHRGRKLGKSPRWGHRQIKTPLYHPQCPTSQHLIFAKVIGHITKLRRLCTVTIDIKNPQCPTNI